MGVTKEVQREGDGENFPKKGDKLTMHYCGTLASNGTKVGRIEGGRIDGSVLFFKFRIRSM